VSAIPPIAALWLMTAPVAAAPAVANPPATPGPDQQVVIRAAYQAAEAMLGPLDGLWRLDDATGRTLFIFDLSDAGGPPAPNAAKPDDPGLEGAWRDPNHAGSPSASGFLDSIRRDDGRLSIRFAESPGASPRRLVLSVGSDGRWTGELAGAGARQAVVMTRF
jgi:hypothetical protein